MVHKGYCVNKREKYRTVAQFLWLPDRSYIQLINYVNSGQIIFFSHFGIFLISYLPLNTNAFSSYGTCDLCLVSSLPHLLKHF